MRERITRLEDTQGRVALSPAIVAMLWTILLGVVGVAGFMARLDARVTDQTNTLLIVTSRLEKHLELPWHYPAAIRYGAIEDRVKRLESHR